MSLFKSRIFKNVSSYTLTMMLSQLLGMIATIKITRILGPEVYGQYGLYISIVAVFLVVSSLGLRQIVIRQIAREPQNTKQVFVISFACRLLGLLLAAVLLLFYQYYKNSSFGCIDVLMIVSLFSLSIWDSLENVLLGQQRMVKISFFYLGFNIIWVITILFIPLDYFNLILVYSLQIIVQILKDIIFFFYSKHKGFYEGAISKNTFFTDSKKICVESFPYYLLFLCGLIISQLPVFFLDINSTKAEIGYFNASNKLLMPVSIVLNAAMLSIFPNFAKLYVSDKAKLVQRVKLAFGIFIGFSISIAFISSLFGKELIYLLFGTQYAESGKVFALQVWFLVLNGGVLSLIGNIFGAIDRQKILSVITIIGEIIAVPLLWWGSKYGAEKLSLAYVVFAMIQLTYCGFVLVHYLKGIKIVFFITITLLVFIAFAISVIIPYSLDVWYKFGIISILILLLFAQRKKVIELFKLFVEK